MFVCVATAHLRLFRATLDNGCNWEDHCSVEVQIAVSLTLEPNVPWPVSSLNVVVCSVYTFSKTGYSSYLLQEREPRVSPDFLAPGEQVEVAYGREYFRMSLLMEFVPHYILSQKRISCLECLMNGLHYRYLTPILYPLTNVS